MKKKIKCILKCFERLLPRVKTDQKKGKNFFLYKLLEINKIKVLRNSSIIYIVFYQNVKKSLILNVLPLFQSKGAQTFTVITSQTPQITSPSSHKRHSDPEGHRTALMPFGVAFIFFSRITEHVLKLLLQSESWSQSTGWSLIIFLSGHGVKLEHKDSLFSPDLTRILPQSGTETVNKNLTVLQDGKRKEISVRELPYSSLGGFGSLGTAAGDGRVWSLCGLDKLWHGEMSSIVLLCWCGTS